MLEVQRAQFPMLQRKPSLVTGGNSLAIRVISFRLVDVTLDRDNLDVDSRAGS